MDASIQPAGSAVTPEKVLQVLSMNDTFSADEAANALIELTGIAKNSVADVRIEVEQILRKLRAEGKIIIVSDAGEEMRFARAFEEG